LRLSTTGEAGEDLIIHSSCGSPVGKIPAVLEGVLWRWWAFASGLAVASLLAFPIVKGMPIGLVPVVLGIGIAIGLKYLPARPMHFLSGMICGSSGRTWVIRVCVLAALLRLPVILFPSVPVSDHLAFYGLATRLASGQGYGPKLLYPPGQPAWLAVWIFLFRDNLRILAAVQSALIVLSIPLLYQAVKPYSEKAARWGCLVIACFPSLILWSGTLGYETTTLFFYVGLLSLYLLALRATGWWEILAWGIVGCAAALAAYVHPTFLSFPLLLVFILWLNNERLRRILLRVAIVAAFMAVLIAPWTVRNYRKYGEVCLISANFGRVLLSANHPNSDGIFYHTADIGADLNPIAKDRFQRDLALKAIRDNPPRFFALAVKKVVYLWGTDTSVLDFVLGMPPRGGLGTKMFLSAVLNVVWGWFVCAWCIGATRGAPWRLPHNRVEVWSAGWIALLWAVHVVMEPQSRHHLPLLPLMALISLPAYWTWVLGGDRSTAGGLHHDGKEAK